MGISLKTPEEIEMMCVSARLAAEQSDYIGRFIKAGVSTDELDRLCHDYTVDKHASRAKNRRLAT
jgi:methionyl aminopeptidase